MMNPLVETVYNINVYFSIIGILLSVIFGFTCHSCIKTVHINLKFLFIVMSIGIVILPFAQLLSSLFATKGSNFVNYYNFFSSFYSLLLQFIRYIDAIISFERLIATIYFRTYDKTFGLLSGLILLIICIVITVFATNFVTWCKLLLLHRDRSKLFL